MKHSHIIAQDKALNILKNAVKSGRIAQAYIFYGPEGVGKLLTALNLAKELNCLNNDTEQRPCYECPACKKIDQYTHPDVKFYFPIPNYDLDEHGVVKSKAEFENYQRYIDAKINSPWKDHIWDQKTAIRIEQIRGLQKDIMMSKYEGRKKIYIIEGFEDLTRQAANSFLKTLEEPPVDTHFILLVRNIEKLLPTILSRCLKIEFHPIPTDMIEVHLLKNMQLDIVKARLFSRLSNGSMKKAICLVKEENLQNMKITLEFLELVNANDDIAFLDWMELRFLKDKKNSELFGSFIQYLCLWIKDLQMCVLCHPSQMEIAKDRIVFINQTELLQKYTSKSLALSESFADLLIKLNDFLAKHTGNVNQKLILSQVYHLFIKTFSNNVQVNRNHP